MSKNSYAIFGLGSFGSKLALELSEAGHTVLVCDVNQNKVDDFCSKVAEAVVCDAANPDAVRELNVSKFDAVIEVHDAGGAVIFSAEAFTGVLGAK